MAEDRQALEVTIAGPLTTASTSYVELPYAAELVAADFTLGTAAVGQAFFANVTVNGTAAYNAATRPTAAAGAIKSQVAAPPAKVLIPVGATVAVTVEQVGTTTAGSDLRAVLEIVPQ